MKSRTFNKFLGVGFVAYIFGTVLLLRPTSHEKAFSRAYKDLRIGMTPAEVEEKFEHSANVQCMYRESMIQYYLPPPPRTRWFYTRGKIDQVAYKNGATINQLEELPDPYDCVVVAYGPEGTLIAYTRIGEELHVHTKARGPVSGASLLDLKPSDFTAE